MDTPHVYFSLLITSLRMHGLDLEGMDDHEFAELIADALDNKPPMGATEEVMTVKLQGVFYGIAEALREDCTDSARASLGDDIPEPTTEQLSDLAHLVPDRHVADYHGERTGVAPGFVEAEVLPEYKHVIP